MVPSEPPLPFGSRNGQSISQPAITRINIVWFWRPNQLRVHVYGIVQQVPPGVDNGEFLNSAGRLGHGIEVYLRENARISQPLEGEQVWPVLGRDPTGMPVVGAVLQGHLPERNLARPLVDTVLEYFRRWEIPLIENEDEAVFRLQGPF